MLLVTSLAAPDLSGTWHFTLQNELGDKQILILHPFEDFFHPQGTYKATEVPVGERRWQLPRAGVARASGSVGIP